MKTPVIVIIGGKGKMGSAFIKLFKRNKIPVRCVDTNTKLTLKTGVESADITIISVPISKTVGILEKALVYARPGSLVTDLTSLKVPTEVAFKKSARRDIEMMGLHPLCGPSMVSNLRAQVIAYCPYKIGAHARWLVNFFKKEKASVKKTTATAHDESMSIIQGITHFSAIASGLALKKLGANVRQTREFASPIYSLRLAMIGRILSQDPALYADIEISNPLTAKAVGAYRDAIEELMSSVTQKDTAAFIKSFADAASYLGGYTALAQKQTDKLIAVIRDEDIL